MGLPIDGGQSLRRNVCVDLRSGQAGVPQQFLHGAQIRATFEQMRCGSVPQPVRGELWRALHRRRALMDQPTHRARIDPAAPPTQEQRQAGGIAAQLISPMVQPFRDARSAGTPNGTTRSFDPLPSTRSTRRCRSTSAMSRPVSSDTRIPDAYSNSSIAWSRSATATSAGPAASASSPAAAGPRVLWRHGGAGRSQHRIRLVDAQYRWQRLVGSGEASRAPTSTASNPVRCAQAVNDLRPPPAPRASDARAAPMVRSLASQLRSAARFSEPGVTAPRRRSTGRDDPAAR